MDIFAVFTLVGGLALFLYGMNLMGEGLEKLAGGKLEKILEKLTSSPIKGLMVGLTVTALIQSSSATTVMLVGFVNSGIMKLTQVISVIMGANIGTTATAWILSLSGIEGDSFWVNLLKPSSFSPILAMIGVVLVIFLKNSKKKDIGIILIGFAILMFGMETMSGAVKPLKDVPEFQQMFVKFTNPILGVLVGAIVTAIIQSSSASVGILQALSQTGSVKFGAALPIILGQNIGTCVTAIISSIGANKNAKRVAVVHLFFNIIGTFLFLAVFYTLNAIIHFAFLDDTVDGFKIAVVHTIFNLTTTLVLLPFTKLLEKIAYAVVKDTGVKEEINILDERLLNTPAIAIENCRNHAIKMAKISKEAIEMAIGLTENYDEKIANDVLERENIVDIYEDKLGTYLVKLSSRSLTNEDSKAVSRLLHAIGDFERIADHAVNILNVAKEKKEKSLAFSSIAQSELQIMTKALNEVLDITIDAFEKNSTEIARTVEPLEEIIDELRMELKRRHILRLQNEKCTIELGFVFSDFLTNLERVSDHCSNVALYIIQISDDNFNTHKYIDNLKNSGEIYGDKYKQFSSKYALPNYVQVK